MILNLNAQIIWVFVDLLILFVLMKKFLFGPITRMLDDRAQEVSDTLDQSILSLLLMFTDFNLVRTTRSLANVR